MGNKNLDFEDMVADGENPLGIVNVNVNGDQVGTTPAGFIGRQQHNWGGDRDGPNFAPYGNDWGLSEEEKAARYGTVPSINPSSPGKRRRK